MDNNDMKIVALLAAFNRKNKTLACLKTIYGQLVTGNIRMEVYLTDDASSDGTAAAVKKDFPSVHLLTGNGNLFWAGGMRNTWTAALKTNADFYLLVNDDTLLEKNCLTKLINCYHTHYQTLGPVICVGTTQDQKTKTISYGGQKLRNAAKVQSYNVYSETEYLTCDMANANIMLVPDAIVRSIGILSDRYTHSIADFDYTLRAGKAGFSVIVVPGILGNCTDDHGRNWKSTDVSLKDRVRYLKSPKGLAYSEYLYFIRTHFPTHLPAAFFKLWTKTLFPGIWDKFKK